MVRSMMAHRTPETLETLSQDFGFDPAQLPANARRAVEALLDALAEAEALADRDSLTPVLNRRAFMREVARMTAFVERYGRPAAVLYLDLDGFKAVNDNFGHAAGDAVLRHVGLMLREHVREFDVVGRIGGDEFAVILAQVSAEEAAAKAQALRALLAATPCVHEGQEHMVRASIGVHPLAALEDAEAALSRADEAMFAAKAVGKKRKASRA